MDLAGSRVLVIGGAGFIGNVVVSELLKTDVAEVIIYDNFARSTLDNIAAQLQDPRCRLYPHGGDVRDVELLDAAMQRVDGVIHLAGLWLLHCRDFPRAAFHANIEGTFNVLEACVRNNVKRLVYSSSASVYGNAEEVPMNEQHPHNNRNFYGATKIAGEAMCRAFHERYALDYVGLRYMNVYGPRQSDSAAYNGVIPQMLDRLVTNEPLVVDGDGTQSYDFIYVEDAARCNVLALAARTVDEFYNVATGVATSIRELCGLLLDMHHSAASVTYRPYDADDVRRHVTNRVGCPRKATRDLGFVYHYALREGLEKLMDWRATQPSSHSALQAQPL